MTHYFINTLICNAYSIPMKLAGKVALHKSYQAHKFWYELFPR